VTGFVWGFRAGIWNQDDDVPAVVQLWTKAATNGLNGAVLFAGLDSPRAIVRVFQRLNAVKAACDRDGLELIPSVFSVVRKRRSGHNRQLAEGMPVVDAPCRGCATSRRRVVPDPEVRIAPMAISKLSLETRIRGLCLPPNKPGW